MTLPFVAAAAALMLGIERIATARRFPQVPGFVARALALNSVQIILVVLAGNWLDPMLASHRPCSADALGLAGSVVAGYLAITLVYYAWHRARHEIPFLWRWLHQLHHSPQRLEILTSFYKHPLEICVNALLSSAILYLLVGVSPEAAAMTVGVTGIAELFYHWNVRTPYWLGFLLQRPESHCIHHERGRHSSNYSDLPLWDILFGTFENRRRFEGECGFADERERLVASMLCGRDVHEIDTGARDVDLSARCELQLRAWNEPKKSKRSAHAQKRNAA